MFPLQLLWILVAAFFLVADYGRAREANQAFEQGDFERAELLYRQLLRDDPQNLPILFNLGTTLAHQGRAEESTELFMQYSMQAQSPGLKAPGEYNLGTLQAQAGETEQALFHFEQTLGLDPDDEDAKFNLELLLRRKQSEQDQKEQQDDGGGSSADSDAMPAGGQSSPFEDSGETTQSSEASRQPADTRNGSTQEALHHAEEILNVLEQIERELIREYQRSQADPVEPHEQDW